ncbi:MAG: reverse transcriptase domain-containing protein, partial [Bacteroidota bacterium]
MGGELSGTLAFKKALYGLKEAPKLWQEELKALMLAQHFKQMKSDPSVFVKRDAQKDEFLIVATWVDDLFIVGDEQLMRNFRQEFQDTLLLCQFLLGLDTQNFDAIP